MNVLLPASLEEACALLVEHPHALPMAGGTDLMVHWPQRLDLDERTFLDLSALAELRFLEWRGDTLNLGAATTYWDVVRDARVGEAFPLLVEAARQVGAVQIQARGTWAGNVINASPAADGVPVLMAYDAVLELVSRDGIEEIPLADFYLGYKKMRRRPDQLLRSIRLERRDHDVEIFEKVGSRRAQAITKVGVAIAHSAAGWRVVANSMAPTVCRCRALEALLEEGVEVRSPEDLLAPVRQDVAPIDDVRSTAAYREKVFARVIYFALWAQGVNPG